VPSFQFFAEQFSRFTVIYSVMLGFSFHKNPARAVSLKKSAQNKSPKPVRSGNPEALERNTFSLFSFFKVHVLFVFWATKTI
jgi:hypothetical protein